MIFCNSDVQSSAWSIDTLYVNTNPDVGYEDGLYDVLWEDTLDKNSVTLKKESPVTNIDSSDSSFVKVTDLHGKIYKAQHVIVTASIAVLQADKISFTPALPAETGTVLLVGWVRSKDVPNSMPALPANSHCRVVLQQMRSPTLAWIQE